MRALRGASNIRQVSASVNTAVAARGACAGYLTAVAGVRPQVRAGRRHAHHPLLCQYFNFLGDRQLPNVSSERSELEVKIEGEIPVNKEGEVSFRGGGPLGRRATAGRQRMTLPQAPSASGLKHSLTPLFIKLIMPELLYVEIEFLSRYYFISFLFKVGLMGVYK